MEILTPDFAENREALTRAIAEWPTLFDTHNIETVRRLRPILGGLAPGQSDRPGSAGQVEHDGEPVGGLGGNFANPGRLA